MKTPPLLVLATLALTPLLARAVESQLPDPPAPFLAESGKSEAPELKIISAGGVEQPSLWVGNKRIGFREKGNLSRDQQAEIMIDGHEIMSFQFCGSFPGSGNFGYPFKTKDGTTPRITCDKAASSITYSKEYLQANGEAAKGVKCQFHRDGNNYSYVMILPQRYIEPLKLEKGWLAGFGLYIHDKDKIA